MFPLGCTLSFVRALALTQQGREHSSAWLLCSRPQTPVECAWSRGGGDGGRKRHSEAERVNSARQHAVAVGVMACRLADSVPFTSSRTLSVPGTFTEVRAKFAQTRVAYSRLDSGMTSTGTDHSGVTQMVRRRPRAQAWTS